MRYYVILTGKAIQGRTLCTQYGKKVTIQHHIAERKHTHTLCCTVQYVPVPVSVAMPPSAAAYDTARSAAVAAALISTSSSLYS
jgi:hypothetical protein